MTNEPMRCFLCRERSVVAGLCCATCVSSVRVDELCPEQIVARTKTPKVDAANAWLVDGFGVPHTLSVAMHATPALRRVVVGRSVDADIQIADRTVSLQHAALEFRPLSQAWFVEDLGSDNGTRVDGDVVRTRHPLESGDVISLGQRVSFVFVPLDAQDIAHAQQELAWLQARFPSTDTCGDPGTTTMPTLKVAAAREGGALATWGRERAALSELEFALLVMLQQAWSEDVHSDHATRGFMPAEQLLSRLPFVSEAPIHTNLRGLVRKIRKKLVDGVVPIDVIESQRGLGYRLAKPIELL
jgi:hypothetical protein